MSLGHESNIKPTVISKGNDPRVEGKVLISPENGWKDYTMRRFKLAKGGNSHSHSHDFPHIVYVLHGEGTLELNNELHNIKEGSYVYIPNNFHHQFRNTNEKDEPLEFICIVPQENHTFG